VGTEGEQHLNAAIAHADAADPDAIIGSETLPACTTAGMETAAAPVRAALVKSRLLQALNMICASRGISQSRAINVPTSSNTIVNHWLSV